ncbi:MAG: CPBP family intramembrane metalloprotease [Ruminococcaceae bacterium]|nr:CPBP family intramembrane metalloprotease [Oscillospiraceae bacterium]
MDRQGEKQSAVFIRISLSLILYIILSLLLSLAAGLIRCEGAAKILVSAAVYAVSISAAIFAAAPKGLKIKLIKKPASFSFIKALALFFAVSLAALLLSLAVSKLLALIGVAPASSSFAFDGPLELFVIFIKYVILSSFLEEILFRGVFISCLRPYGDGFALIVSSLLFAFSHTSLASLPSAFLYGLFFGYLYLKTGSLIPSVIFHFLNNAVAFLSQYLATVNASAYSAFAVILYSVCALSAILTVFFLLRRKSRAFLNLLTDRKLSPLGFFGNFAAAAWVALSLLLILRNTETLI